MGRILMRRKCPRLTRSSTKSPNSGWLSVSSGGLVASSIVTICLMPTSEEALNPGGLMEAACSTADAQEQLTAAGNRLVAQLAQSEKFAAQFDEAVMREDKDRSADVHHRSRRARGRGRHDPARSTDTARSRRSRRARRGSGAGCRGRVRMSVQRCGPLRRRFGRGRVALHHYR